jgi:pSer/pThr/pTyr-binding forkhead associated (FHA) protein
MSSGLNGYLVPVGGGDDIPLIRAVLTVGRRESCDVCMRFPNISGLHCELSFRDGYWYIRDLNSTNGVKVNNTRVQEKVLLPSDVLTIGKRKYTIEYTMPADKRAPDEELTDVMGESLLEKAGLERKRRPGAPSRATVNPLDALRRHGHIDEEDDDD